MATGSRVPLPFGGGLDRASGASVAVPTTFRDLRNVALYEGKMAGRGGLERRLLLAGVTDILAIHPIRSQGVGVIVAYDSAGQTVSLWITTGSASETALVAALPWVFDANAVLPPRVFVADSYDRVFIAHDEPLYIYRQATQVYDVLAGTIETLDAGGALGTLRFRGVTRHLNYLLGWGYGTAAEPDRPEIVRASLPADPLTWDANHYWIAGQRGDPVLKCESAGEVCLVMKQTETHDIFGYDRATFGIRPGDRYFGLAGSHLAVTVGGVNYRWGLDGPRRSVGGQSEDLALPLDLPGVAVDALAQNLDLDNGIAAYQPDTKEVLFCFGRWCFVLHLAELPTLKWSYRVFAVAVQAAGILYDTGGATLGPDADVSLDAVNNGSSDYELQLAVTKTGDLHGGEIMDVFVRSALFGTPAGWELHSQRAVLALGVENFQIGGLLAGLDYDVAVRIKRQGVPDALHANADPTLWPVSAFQLDANNTTLSKVVADSYVSEDDGLGHQVVRITLADLPPNDVPDQAHISYEMQADFVGGSWVDVTGAQPDATDLVNHRVTSNDRTADIGNTYPFRVRVVTFQYQGPWSDSIMVTI